MFYIKRNNKIVGISTDKAEAEVLADFHDGTIQEVKLGIKHEYQFYSPLGGVVSIKGKDLNQALKELDNIIKTNQDVLGFLEVKHFNLISIEVAE